VRPYRDVFNTLAALLDSLFGFPVAFGAGCLRVFRTGRVRLAAATAGPRWLTVAPAELGAATRPARTMAVTPTSEVIGKRTRAAR